MNRLFLTLLLIGVAATAAVADDHGARDGQVRAGADGAWQAFSEQRGEWVSPEIFWLEYAESKDGLTWGRGSEYPEYAQVKEYDLFLVDTAQGPCLMEFFHERWRRANDVRRWDEAFNEVLGCPYVFD